MLRKKLTIYSYFIVPYLTYYVEVWGNTYTTNISFIYHSEERNANCV